MVISTSRLIDLTSMHILHLRHYLVTKPFPALDSFTLEDPGDVTSIQVSGGVTPPMSSS